MKSISCRLIFCVSRVKKAYANATTNRLENSNIEKLNSNLPESSTREATDSSHPSKNGAMEIPWNCVNASRPSMNHASSQCGRASWMASLLGARRRQATFLSGQLLLQLPQEVQ